jgi:hypothetical protein
VLGNNLVFFSAGIEDVIVFGDTGSETLLFKEEEEEEEALATAAA